MSKHLFTNVTVLDCSGDEPFSGEVLVEGNEIVAVARKANRCNATAQRSSTVATGPP